MIKDTIEKKFDYMLEKVEKEESTYTKPYAIVRIINALENKNVIDTQTRENFINALHTYKKNIIGIISRTRYIYLNFKEIEREQKELFNEIKEIEEE